MGLLKSFLRGLASEAGRVVADKISEQLGVSGSSEEVAMPIQRNSERTVSSNRTEYFRTILQEDFSGYTVKENVSVEQLGWDSVKEYRDPSGAYPCRPYAFVLYQGERLAAVILLTAHNKGYLAIHKNTVATAKAYGVPCINFFTHMENERSYVKDRIEKALV